MYAPLAHRLGVQEIKHEMENRSFEILFPGRFREIDDLIQQRAPEREVVIEKITAEIEMLLDDAGIEAATAGRPKHHYSIYKKMMDSRLPFEDIHDLIGVRILVDEVSDCYGALGLIHAIWPPLQGRFKDYIAMPKFNLYQSLHTTVIGPDGKPIEVQIRTREMDERAEIGIAAHWRYKEGSSAAELRWMSDLRFLQEEYDDPTEFLANLKLDLYQDEVFVLTPRGDVQALPVAPPRWILPMPSIPRSGIDVRELASTESWFRWRRSWNPATSSKSSPTKQRILARPETGWASSALRELAPRSSSGTRKSGGRPRSRRVESAWQHSCVGSASRSTMQMSEIRHSRRSLMPSITTEFCLSTWR